MKLIDLSLSAFADRVASSDPTPGGGSVAALQGSTAAALTVMSARVTVGRKGFEAVESRMNTMIEQAMGLQTRLMQAVDEDAESYRMVMNAFRMPKATEAEKAARASEIQKAFKQAARVPLQTAQDALEVMGLSQTVVFHGNPNAVSDALAAVLAARSAVAAACYNVKINLSSIKDDDFVGRMEEAADRLLKQAIDLEEEIRGKANVGGVR